MRCSRDGWRESCVDEAKVRRLRFFRELGFIDGLRRQPFVYWGFILSEEVNS